MTNNLAKNYLWFSYMKKLVDIPYLPRCDIKLRHKYFPLNLLELPKKKMSNTLNHLRLPLDFFCRYCLVNTFDEELNETYEIALVCFPENEPEIVKVSFTIKAIFIFISVFFLILTLYIYYRLPELRQTQVKNTSFLMWTAMRYSNFFSVWIYRTK